MVKTKFSKLKNWVKENQLEFILLIVVLFVGAFFRLYKIDQYMTFLGDEGRDVIIVRRLLIEHHPPLIGPGTSIGNMYLGPVYYYMMAIPLLLANFNPVGPAVFIALLGIVTIFFVWHVIHEFFPTDKIHVGALIAALLYAISPVIIIYSRSSWNPNIMPFFSLLTIYSIWRVWIKKQYKWLMVVGVAFACVLQSHYLGLLLLSTILIIWFSNLLKAPSKKKFLVFSLISLFLFLLLMSPLAIFDIRHNFINSKAILAFFTNRETTVSVLPWKALPSVWPIFTNIASDLVGAKNDFLGEVLAGVVIAVFAYVYLFRKEKYDIRRVSTALTLTMWIGFGLVGLALYKQHIYDHYYGFMFTAPFIVIGGILNRVFRMKHVVYSILGAVFVLAIAFFDIQNSPLRYPPNMQLTRTQTIAKKVMEVANGEKFNFTIIAERNYDNAYRYFLNTWGAKVTDIDPLDTKDTITPQLLVVCELPKEKCDPTHNPKAEVAQWGWSKVDETWEVEGTTLFKLGHAR